MSPINVLLPHSPEYIYRAMIRGKHRNKQRSQKLVVGISEGFKFLGQFTFEKIENTTIQLCPRSSNTCLLYRVF